MPAKKKTVKKRKKGMPRMPAEPRESSGTFFYGVKKIKRYKNKEGEVIKTHHRVIALSWRSVALMAAGFLVTRWIYRTVRQNVKDIAAVRRNQRTQRKIVNKTVETLKAQHGVIQKILENQQFRNYIGKKEGYKAITTDKATAEAVADRLKDDPNAYIGDLVHGGPAQEPATA